MSTSLLKISCLFGLVMAFSSLAIADDLNLHMAVEEALHSSPVIKKSLSEVDKAYAKKLDSYSGFVPDFSGDASYLFAKKYVVIGLDFGGQFVVVPQILPTTQFQLNASLPIFDGLANVNRFKASSRLYDSAQSDFEWTKFVTEMQTTLLFYKSIVAKDLLNVAQQNVDTINDHYKDVKALFKAGVSTKFDVLRVEVQMNEAQSESLKSQNEYEFAKIRLAKSMGRESDTREPVGPIPSVPATLVANFDKEKNDRKDLQALELQGSSSLHLEKAANSFWYPKISLIGQVQAYNNTDNDITNWDAYRNAYNAGINLHWDFFDGMVSIAKSKAAKADYANAGATLRTASLQANEDEQIWKKQFVYFTALVDVKNTQMAEASEAVRLARESVRAGTKTNTDLLDAELDLFKSRADILNVEMGVVEALIYLEMATGQKVYDFHS